MDDALRQRLVEAEERQDWTGALALLQEAADLSTAISPRIFFLGEQARVFEERLGDHLGAIECWRRIVELDASAVDALRELERLYLLTVQLDAALTVLHRQIELTRTSAEVAALWRKIAGVCEQLGDSAGARSALERAAEAG